MRRRLQGAALTSIELKRDSASSSTREMSSGDAVADTQRTVMANAYPSVGNSEPPRNVDGNVQVTQTQEDSQYIETCRIKRKNSVEAPNVVKKRMKISMGSGIDMEA